MGLIVEDTGGLLGFIRSPEGQGLLSAAFGGLAGAQRGAPLNSLGRAGMAGLMGYSGAQDREQRLAMQAQAKKLQNAQISNYESEVQQRNAAMQKQAEIKATIKQLMQEGGPKAEQGQMGSGSFGVMPTVNGAPDMPVQQPGTWLTRLPLEKVVGLKVAGGPDLTKDWELGQTGVEMKPGSVYKNGNTTTFGPPTIDKNMQLQSDGRGGFRTSVVPGAAQAVSELAGAQEGAKAALDFIDVPMGDGRTVKMSRADAAKVLSQAPQTPAEIPSVGNSQPTPEQMRVIRADIARTGNPSPSLNFNTSTVPYKPVGGSTVQFGATQSPMEVGQQKNIIDAGGKINDTWLKTSYEPTITAGQSAQSVIDNTQIAREAMRKMGGTGWGTDAKAAAANMLTGLGIASKNSELYASNAQVFQKAASERLWSVLNSAKGPQTEGDAARASKTYGQLGNTTSANEFIFDLAQANAEREKAKAAFFSNALPIAKQNGDLSEVEREWNARMPSIFNMPSMKRWNK